MSFRASDETLQKVAETAFDPWGVVLRVAGFVNGTHNRFEFQDNESEKTFGLNRVNFGFRTYNPAIGRFDRADPLTDLFETLTPYDYVTNNPVSIIDLFGLDTTKMDQLPQNWHNFNPEKDVVLTNEISVKGHYNRNFNTDGIQTSLAGNNERGEYDVERVNNYNRRIPFTKEEMRQRSGAVEPDHTLEAIFIPLPSIVKWLRGVRFSRAAAKTGSTAANRLGQQMHKEYKIDDVLNGVRIKEFTLPSRKRIDFIDLEKKIIYELKPNNSRAIKQGYKQLEIYKQEVESLYGNGFKTKLDTY